MNALDRFEATDRTVKSFNATFPRSPLDFAPDAPVKIGRLVQGGFRELEVAGETVLHEIILPREATTMATKVVQQQRKTVSEAVTYSSYNVADMEMDAPVYKLWQVLKAQTTEWHTERGLSEATKLNEKRVRLSLRELKVLGKITLETSNRGIKVGIL